MKYPYYVEQKYDDKGKIHTKILAADQAKNLGYEDGYREETEKYDLYVDGCDSIQTARDFIKECKNA